MADYVADWLREELRKSAVTMDRGALALSRAVALTHIETLLNKVNDMAMHINTITGLHRRIYHLVRELFPDNKGLINVDHEQGKISVGEEMVYQCAEFGTVRALKRMEKDLLEKVDQKLRQADLDALAKPVKKKKTKKEV